MIKKTSKLSLIVVLVFMAATLYVVQAKADTLEISLDVEFSGGTEPEGLKPWATATFADSSTDSVTLTMSTVNLVDTEFISVWLFNFDPFLDPELLSFTFVGAPGSNPITINSGSDSFKAGPNKFYDIEFDFPTSNGKSSDRFTAGETVVYDISYNGYGTIRTSSFNFSSTNGPYHSAAHVQSIGARDGSGWIGNTTVVPEPVSSLLFISGGTILGFRRFWKKKRTA